MGASVLAAECNWFGGIVEAGVGQGSIRGHLSDNEHQEEAMAVEVWAVGSGDLLMPSVFGCLHALGTTPLGSGLFGE